MPPGPLRLSTSSWSATLQFSGVSSLRDNSSDFGGGSGLPGEPKIRSIGLLRYRGEVGATKIYYWSSGLAKVGHVTSYGFSNYIGGRHFSQIDDSQFYRNVSLSRFLSEPAAIINDGAVSRRDIVKDVANKLGGVHFDERRGLSEKPYLLLDSVRDQPFVWPIFQADGEDATEEANFPRGPVFRDLIAIGQALTASPDVVMMVDVAPSTASWSVRKSSINGPSCPKCLASLWVYMTARARSRPLPEPTRGVQGHINSLRLEPVGLQVQLRRTIQYAACVNLPPGRSSLLGRSRVSRFRRPEADVVWTLMFASKPAHLPHKSLSYIDE
jgi:hypothetical protein